MRYYKAFKHIHIKNSNCLLFSIWYRINKGGKLKSEFDKKLFFWHFYIKNDWKEIHMEQNNRKTERWKPLINGHVKIYYKY